MALSANAGLKTRNDAGATTVSLVVLTSSIIYRHALVARTAAGLATPAANSATSTLAGIALDDQNSKFPITGDGTKRVTCTQNIDVLISAVTAITVGMVQDTAIYCVDDAQVTNATTLGPAAGFVGEFVAANSVWLTIRGGLLGNAS